MAPSFIKVINSQQNILFHKTHIDLLIKEFTDFKFIENVETEKNILLDKKSNFLLEVDKLSFSYKKNLEIIKNTNLKFYKNKIHLIKGSSGSGKSTFIDILTGLLKPTRGSCNLIINGKKFNMHRNFDILKSAMGLMPQNVIVFNDTIKNNLTFTDHNNNQTFNKKFNCYPPL